MLKPISQLPKGSIRAVFSDLDDTLTDHSIVLPETYFAIHRLKKAGFKVAIVSGRPAGWADALMRIWPIDAMVFENGAGVVTRDGDKLITHCLAEDSDLARQRQHLQSLFDRLKQEIPHLKLASDQPFRKFDFAIDFCEEPPRLTETELKRVLDFLQEDEKITAKLSSIHVNYWYGKHTKVTACDFLMKALGERDPLTPDQVVFSGDSPNDEPLFAFFPKSVGVANVKRYIDRMKSLPYYVTENPSGRGFQEIAETLLSK